MDRLLLVAAGGALLLGAAVLVPFVLPWPMRVRWLVISQAMGHDAPGYMACPALDLREVVLVAVEAYDPGLVLRALEVGRPARDAVTFTTPTSPTAEVVSMFQEWRALETPVLLYVDDGGTACVSGPAATISNLRRVTPCYEE